MKEQQKVDTQTLMTQIRRQQRVNELHGSIYAEAQKQRGSGDAMYGALTIACSAIAQWEERYDQQQKVVEELGRRVAQEQVTNEALLAEINSAKEKNVAQEPIAANEEAVAAG